MKQTIINIIITTIVVGGVSFYGGVKYAQNKTPQGRLAQTNFQNLQNLSPEERRERLQQFGANINDFRAGTGGNRNRGANGGFASGEIISQDDKSLTIKLQDGGSKFIFFSGSTEIHKSVKGTADDLKIGKNITASGAPNPDGSITAEMIQLKPQTIRGQP